MYYSSQMMDLEERPILMLTVVLIIILVQYREESIVISAILNCNPTSNNNTLYIFAFPKNLN